MLLALTFLVRFRRGRWRGMRVIEHVPAVGPPATACLGAEAAATWQGGSGVGPPLPADDRG